MLSSMGWRMSWKGMPVSFLPVELQVSYSLEVLLCYKEGVFKRWEKNLTVAGENHDPEVNQWLLYAEVVLLQATSIPLCDNEKQRELMPLLCIG